MSAKDDPGELILPLVEERVVVSKRPVETGRVRVRTRVRTRDVNIEADLAREDVEVERVPVDRDVDQPPQVRMEGDVLVVPVVEEVVVVEKRLRLKEEIRIRRRRRVEHTLTPVTLRRTEAEIQRRGKPDEPSVSAEEYPMNRTVTAFFDTRQHAEEAKARLAAAGVRAEEITITDQSMARGDPGHHHSFFGTLKDFFVPEADRQTYAEGLRRGGALLSAQVDDARADNAIQALEDTRAVDIDKRRAEWMKAGWKGRDELKAGEERAIPIVEERLVVGKREVERGHARVRSYIVTTPVREHVDLREERVRLERRAADRPAGEELFREREIEAREMGEEAVVGKEARVREELILRKEAEMRGEDIDDSVRHTEVDVEDDFGLRERSTFRAEEGLERREETDAERRRRQREDRITPDAPRPRR
ncbi:DUF2382 domain-containing protein [Caulobacter sp. 17J65-9]|uniref:DUF2382 domain-containing protein n=1 Tax=Caulobacter sp. 17J65-9 TaxID=2709382 RepID=UPI001969A672|nr:DUF2382 domain-containing protein [Caulobacter sp. 17J65-9]